jgi:hypothetical protein
MSRWRMFVLKTDTIAAWHLEFKSPTKPDTDLHGKPMSGARGLIHRTVMCGAPKKIFSPFSAVLI